MATLQGTSLLNCNYIPDFIASGSIVLFENGTAPTSWTKLVTFNDTTCRVVSGSVSNGGSTAFSSVFTTRTAAGSINSGTATVSWASNTGPVTVNNATAPTASVGNGSYGVSSHTHSYTFNGGGLCGGGGVTGRVTQPTTLSTGTIGGSGSHTHSVSYSAQSHTHPATASSHTHPSLSWSHTHPSLSVSQNFNIYYVDVILASKD